MGMNISLMTIKVGPGPFLVRGVQTVLPDVEDGLCDVSTSDHFYL